MADSLVQRITVMLFAATLGITSASAEPGLQDHNVTVAGNNTFALDLYSKLRQEKGNLFFSPYSISAAMAMCYGGARGDTAEEMANVFHFTQGTRVHPAFAELNTRLEALQNNGQVQLHIANSLWPQQGYPLAAEYLTLTKQHYGASITPLDFTNTAEASHTINRWVENATEQKIRDMVRPGDLDPKTVLVLINAIYFKGNWASRFDPQHTKRARFSLPGNTTTQVPMLHQKGSFKYAQIEGVQLLELPYAGNSLSMVVILPAARGNLSRIEDNLTPNNLDAWLSQMSHEDVEVYLPKFKVTWGAAELNKPLQALGMRKAFASTADFSGIASGPSLFIGSVFHKAYVEVNEDGTEAAAATSVMMKRGFSSPMTFKADHPFLFLIRDNTTGSILFLGRLVDPMAHS